MIQNETNQPGEPFLRNTDIFHGLVANQEPADNQTWGILGFTKILMEKSTRNKR